MSIMFLFYLLASLFYTYVGMATFIYNPKNKANRLFLIICINLALWAMMLTLINAVSDAETATEFRRIATFFWSTIYCLLLHLFIVVVEKDRILKKIWILIPFYSPALISIYLYYFYIPITASDIVKLSYSWAYLNPIGKGFLWDQFLTIYYISYSLAGILLLAVWGIKSKIRREKQQAIIIITTYIAVLLIGSVTDIILPNLGLPLIPPLSIIFIMIPIAGIWYSIKKYRLMNLNPENVVLDVMKSMTEGMIIVDRHWCIQELNKGAEAILGYTKSELKDHFIDAIHVDDSVSRKETNIESQEMLLRTKNETEISVLLTTSVLSDKWKEPYGFVLIFQDITEIRKIQNKLKDAYDEMEIKVQERTEELNAANIDLKKEIVSHMKMEEEIRKLAYYDHLTNLPNRKLFYDCLSEKINDKLRNERPFSVMFMDLDYFKMINDTMGHEKGDLLLRKVAVRMSKTLENDATIGRIGGDEFLIIVDNTPDKETSEKIANKLVESLRKPFNLAGNEIYISASIGIASYPVDGLNSDTLVQNADIAMYKAKVNGRNRYETCTPQMKSSLTETMKISNRLYRAIDNHELELYYQPQVDTFTGNIIGIEALIRWNHPDIGIIVPDDFIPIAEETGLIIPIGEWVIRTACRQNKEWQDKGLFVVPIAVNISIKQFTDVNFVGMVSKILEECQLDPCYLEVEITESVLMKEVCIITEKLEEINRLGIMITIDDFGTEFSSLFYLKQLPIDRIKIDRAFVQGIASNYKDEAIIDAIVTLTKNLGIKSLAEGVETADQMHFLKNISCDAIQGFYFYKPGSAKMTEELFGEYS